MSNVPQFSADQIKGIEAKHITYVVDQENRSRDLHVVKEVVHLHSGEKIPRIVPVYDYKRPYWITQKGRRNHQEKKDYELESNLVKYMSTQLDLPKAIANSLGDRSMGFHPRLRQLNRSPYVYGTDVSSVCYLKNDYRMANPGLISRNTVAGGDIETDVVFEEYEGQIICMSVSHKENVYLAYLKRWVADLDDPIKETFEELEKIPELVSLKKGRNLNIVIEVVNTPADIIIQCLKRLHQWKPDFFTFWNIDFDMSRILNTLGQYGIDPKDVFSDPVIPRNFKYFHYKVDEAMTVTASGVTKSKGPEDQWHWVTAPASFQCIDSMATYRVTRVAKGKESSYALDNILKKELNVEEEETISSEEDLNKFLKKTKKIISERAGCHPYWSVGDPSEDIVTIERVYEENESDVEDQDFDDEDFEDYEQSADSDVTEVFEFTEVEVRETQWADVPELIWGDTVKAGFKVKLNLNFGKLKFAETDHLGGIEWHKKMQKDYKVRYGLYNIIDSIRLEQLDEKINDLSTSITLFSKSSDFKNFNSNPKRLCDDMHFWYLNRPEPGVIGSSSDQMVHDLDSYVVSHKSWIVTLAAFMAGPNGIECIKEFPKYKSLAYCHVADLDK